MTTFLVDESTFLGRDEHIGYILSGLLGEASSSDAIERNLHVISLSGHGRYWENDSGPNYLQPSHCVGIF